MDQIAPAAVFPVPRLTLILPLLWVGVLLLSRVMLVTYTWTWRDTHATIRECRGEQFGNIILVAAKRGLGLVQSIGVYSLWTWGLNIGKFRSVTSRSR